MENKNPSIALINPSVSFSSQNKYIQSIINISFPTSLGFIASYLKQHGYNSIIRDEQIAPLDDLELKKLVDSLTPPRIIGISSLTINSGRAYALASQIKKIDPKSIVVIGGIHPTVLPEEPLGVPEVDVVALGEGEDTMLELVQKIMKGEDYLTGVAGIAYRSNGGIKFNDPRPLRKNLDEIPPLPYEMFSGDLEKYPNFAIVYGSRGCPYNCIFCSARSMSGRKFRHHSVERIIADIKHLVNDYKQTFIHLIDDNIAVNKQHFYNLCDAIIAEGLHEKASFSGSLRGDDATDEVLRRAKEANFSIIYYGLETGSERLMKIINKGETVQDVVDAIYRAQKHGLPVGTTIIFGIPSETRKERWQAMKKVWNLPLESVRFNTLAPYPGTPVYGSLDPEKDILIKKNWENFGVQYMWESDDIPYVPKGGNRLDLIFDTMFANLSFYLRPAGLKKLLTSQVAGGNVIRLKSRWYLHFTEAWKMFLAFQYLFRRFMSVAVRMAWQHLTRALGGGKQND